MKKYDNIRIRENAPFTRYIIGIDVSWGKYLLCYDVAMVDSDCFFFVGSRTLIETSHNMSRIFTTSFEYVGS